MPGDEPRERRTKTVIIQDELVYALMHRKMNTAEQQSFAERELERIAREILEQMLVIANRYGITLDSDDLKPGSKLSNLLTGIAVEEITFCDRLPKGKGRPRRSDLIALIDALDAQTKTGLNIRQACEALSREENGAWHGNSPENLKRRYFEFKKFLKLKPGAENKH
jgi:hypothetical protein